MKNGVREWVAGEGIERWSKWHEYLQASGKMMERRKKGEVEYKRSGRGRGKGNDIRPYNSSRIPEVTFI